MSTDGEPIWVPAPDDVRAANVSRFARWLAQHGRPAVVRGLPDKDIDP